MKVIHKQELNFGIARVYMPNGYRVVEVAPQNGVPCIWYEFDPELQKDKTEKEFSVFGTGHLIPDNMRYVGTFHLPDQLFVGHVYEEEK